MSEFEITALVLAEHDVIRREFEALEGVSAPDQLERAWRALAARLEVHAVGEEELFYPLLARAAQDAVQDSVEAVHDHNEIRAAVRAVDEHETGSQSWQEAVRAAREVNGDHMAEEERDFLPEFRDSVDAQRREDLGMRWLEFHDRHEDGEGLSGEDADPQEVVAGASDGTTA